MERNTKRRGTRNHERRNYEKESTNENEESDEQQLISFFAFSYFVFSCSSFCLMKPPAQGGSWIEPGRALPCFPRLLLICRSSSSLVRITKLFVRQVRPPENFSSSPS